MLAQKYYEPPWDEWEESTRGEARQLVPTPRPLSSHVSLTQRPTD